MAITKKLYEALMHFKPITTLYLLGAKGEKEPYTVAKQLESDGGCSNVIPSVPSPVITSAMISLCREGCTHFIIAWTPAAGRTPGRTGNDLAKYFKAKSNGLNGMFITTAGAHVYIGGNMEPTEIV